MVTNQIQLQVPHCNCTSFLIEMILLDTDFSANAYYCMCGLTLSNFFIKGLSPPLLCFLLLSPALLAPLAWEFFLLGVEAWFFDFCPPDDLLRGCIAYKLCWYTRLGRLVRGGGNRIAGVLKELNSALLVRWERRRGLRHCKGIDKIQVRII